MVVCVCDGVTFMYSYTSNVPQAMLMHYVVSLHALKGLNTYVGMVMWGWLCGDGYVGMVLCYITAALYVYFHCPCTIHMYISG